MPNKEIIGRGTHTLGPESSAQPSILVIDDEPSILQFVEFALVTEGYEVTTAGNAEDGFELLLGTEKHPYRLLVTDIRLPGKDGLQMLKDWRDYESGKKLPHIPAIVMTASPGDLTGVELDEYTSRMDKPFNVDPFISLVKEQLLKSIQGESPLQPTMQA